ncbi:ribosomal large subunit pseudouridine synthase D [mine drainage metagenome]|uniref:Ribosomal large subunit pseudouridine synthase D n=1 Tax=mine drainage metagenome TaxID=410659 RepID=A0A1J5RH52_9ZZZZ
MLTTEDLRRRILYLDEAVLILDKPGGLAVHKGTGTRTDLEQALPLLFGAAPPRLAHRLDMDTSGCLVLSRTADAATRLGRLFSQRRVNKCYWALVQGRPDQAGGIIDLALRKLPGPEGGRMRPDPSAPPAITRWRRLGTADGVSWLELRPETGRTHQLRAHCALMGWPILGDRLYGRDQSPPLLLHARSISFQMEPARPPITATAPVPAAWEPWRLRFGFGGGTNRVIP